jgi:drug/metabolite transporter (DMT)-like permease
MFLGELFCLLIYGVKRALNRSSADNSESMPINPALIAIPACFDICGSTLMFIALTMCAASVYQMMRGFIVVITALMALIFLGRKQFSYHWASLFTIVGGVAIVGYVSIMNSDAKSAGATSITGIIFLLAAQCFTGGQFVTEEKFLSGTNLDPLLVVGLEGFWGCLVFAILLPIF